MPGAEELEQVQSDLREADEAVVGRILGGKTDDAQVARLQAQLAELELDPGSVEPAGDGSVTAEGTSGDEAWSLRLVRGAEGWAFDSLVPAQR